MSIRFFSALTVLSLSVAVAGMTSCVTRQLNQSQTASRTYTEQDVSRFIARTRWPRYADYLDTFGGFPDDRNFNGYTLIEYEKNDMVQLIAALEKTFPNGQYRCLGRDAIEACDALDIFFKNYDRSNRVGYFEASGSTFSANSIQETREIMKRFITSEGFDPKPYVSDLANQEPFVMLDATGWNTNGKGPYASVSQARGVLRAAYELISEEQKRQGVSVPLTEYLSKVNVFAVHSGSGQQQGQTAYSVRRGFDPSQYYNEVKQEMINYEWDHPSNIMRVQLTSIIYGGYYLNRGNTFWHDSYGTLNQVRPGIWKAEPTAQFPNSKKYLVASRMRAYDNFILSDEFRAMLRSAGELWDLERLKKWSEMKLEPSPTVALQQTAPVNPASVPVNNPTALPQLSSWGFPIGEFSFKGNSLLLSERNDGLQISLKNTNNNVMVLEDIDGQALSERKRRFIAQSQLSEICNNIEVKLGDQNTVVVSWKHVNSEDPACADSQFKNLYEPFRGEYKRVN